MTEQEMPREIRKLCTEGATENTTEKWPLAHLLAIVYYEYPDLPMPHSGEFHGLIQVASSHTYNQHNGRYKGGSGLVIGYWMEDLWAWIQENSPIAVDYAKCRKAIDKVETPCPICGGTERPLEMDFAAGEELQLEGEKMDVGKIE